MKEYVFWFFGTNNGENISKSVSKNLSAKYSAKDLFDYAKRSAIDALKTSLKGVIQKTI